MTCHHWVQDNGLVKVQIRDNQNSLHVPSCCFFIFGVLVLTARARGHACSDLYLHLGMNPLVCDCRLDGLISFLKENDVEKSGVVCGMPLGLKNLPLKFVKERDLVCQGTVRSKVLIWL